MLKRLFNKLLSRLAKPKGYANLTDYWRNRARQYGKRSVLNISHSEDEFELITAQQKQILFPLLQTQLSGKERNILDFGCGPGRFTIDLTELISGTAIGVDVAPELIMLAPKSSKVVYQCIDTNHLPFADSSFDVVWSCLVLGGIPDSNIRQSIAEIERVLKPGGIFFYVENTATAANEDHWFFRNEKSYIVMATFCNPVILGRYKDVGQPITIFSGRKISKYEKSEK